MGFAEFDRLIGHRRQSLMQRGTRLVVRREAQTYGLDDGQAYAGW